MKFKLTLFYILLSASLVNAQLVSYEFIQSYSLAQMNTIVSDFGASGVITPSYAVDVYRVFYRTEYNDSTTVVTGALAIPQNPDCKSPLISYQHGTVSRRANVPSYGSTELQICLVFASEGNVLVAPDYIGLGGSTIPLHPYQHAFSQAHSTINLLRATRELQTDLNFELSAQIFLFGYSQGGHATASALKYIEQDYSAEFQVTAAMPMSGAYDLSGSQTDFVNSGLPYATPGYLPYIVMGYQSVYHDLYDSIQQIFIPPYDSTMPYYFLDGTYGIGSINNQSDPIPENMFTQEARDAFYNDPNFPFKVRLQENDLLDWTPQSKIRMYYCTGDEQVYYRNSVVADSVWNLNGAPDASAVFLTNEDHAGCVDDALIAARLFFGNLANNGIDIRVAYNEDDNSFTIDIANDDLSDYDILWADGSTGASISNVQSNVNYEVTLTDKVTGCNNTRRFTKETISDISDRNEIVSVNVYPNPSSDFIIIDLNLKENKVINILDNQGKVVYNFEFQKGSEPLINISALSAGNYYILIDGYTDYQASFVKK
jgi:pimeloyl-ACP methyl ester carboxylesterase